MGVVLRKMMELSGLRKKAREQVRGQLWAAWAVLFVVYVGQMLMEQVNFWVGCAVSLLVAGSGTLALAMIFLGVWRKGARPQVKDLLLGFRNGNYARGLIGNLRYLGFILLWCLLLVVPGIVKMLAYSQMFYLMADNPGMEPREAQARSVAMMKGHKWELARLYLSFLPWLAVMLMVGYFLGMVLVMPYPTMSAALAGFYDKLKKEGGK